MEKRGGGANSRPLKFPRTYPTSFRSRCTYAVHSLSSFPHTLHSSVCPTDSPYDVSGLPYQENYDEDAKPPQQVSLSYDESLESGYSTPNSRGRRIIREIIV